MRVGLGLALFMLCFLVSRVLLERSYRHLSVEQKANMMDSFSRFRIFSAVPVFAALLLFIVAFDRFKASSVTSLGFAGFLILYSIVLNVVIYARLRGLDSPRPFMRTYVLARSVSFLGFVALVLAVLIAV